MTVKTDIASLVPTSTAKATFQSKGVDLVNLVGALQRMAIEMQGLINRSILSPDGLGRDCYSERRRNLRHQRKVTITGTTGTGTKFTATGNISGGALSGPLTIVNAGSYSVDPTSLSAEPVTGGGLSGATVALTMSGDNSVLASLNSILSELL